MQASRKPMAPIVLQHVLQGISRGHSDIFQSDRIPEVHSEVEVSAHEVHQHDPESAEGLEIDNQKLRRVQEDSVGFESARQHVQVD